MLSRMLLKGSTEGSIRPSYTPTEYKITRIAEFGSNGLTC